MSDEGKHKENVAWIGALSLEQALRKALEEGKENEIVAILQLLPLDKREKYRELWKQTKRRKKNES